MPQIEKSVFISYRRTNIGYALAIFQNLTQQGFDVFFDYNSIDSGDFEQIILNNIASRAHFVVLLTPSALERLDEPGDWLRREIEYAIQTKRNIVPLTMENFDWSAAGKHLTGGLAPLKSYNALRVPADYFMEAMDRLCTRHLNITLDAVLHPRNTVAQRAANKAQQQAKSEPQVKEKELTAQEWFEFAYRKHQEEHDFVAAIEYYSKAIELDPKYSMAYNNRGWARHDSGDLEGAMADAQKAIALDPINHYAYVNRGRAHRANGNLDSAIADYNEAIRLKPDYADAYHNRGTVHEANGDLSSAMENYNQAIHLKPDHANAYFGRGVFYWKRGEWMKCIDEWEKVLQLDPNHENAKEWLPKARAKLK